MISQQHVRSELVGIFVMESNDSLLIAGDAGWEDALNQSFAFRHRRERDAANAAEKGLVMFYLTMVRIRKLSLPLMLRCTALCDQYVLCEP